MKVCHNKISVVLAITIILQSLFFVPLLLYVPSVGAAPVDWWDSKWNFRRKVTINHTMVEAQLQNFPVLLTFLDTNLSKAQIDGDDFVFISDNYSRLSHEIEFFDSERGVLVAWVELPSLSNTEDTEIYLYYGNPTVTNQQNATQVWDANFIMVQHLEEPSGSRLDSTSNGNNGTPYRGVSQSTSGKIDGADFFDGVDDYIQVNDSPSLNPSSAIMIELWVNLSSTGNYINLVNKGTYNQFYLRMGPSEGRTYWFVRFSDGTSRSIESSNTGWKWNTWHHVAVVADTQTQTIRLYVDGVERLNGGFAAEKALSSTINPLRVSDPSQRPIKGTVDELRISNKSRSAEWILTSYNNQKNPSEFYTMGIEESHSLAPFLTNENPSNEATDVYTNPTLSIRATHPNKDNMTVVFRTNASGIWEDIMTYHNVGDGDYSVIPTNMVRLGTKYYWSASASDGEEWTNQTYSFKTTTNVLTQKWVTNSLVQGESGVLIADVVGNELEEIIHAGKYAVVVLNGTDGSQIWRFEDSNLGYEAQSQIADLNRDGIPEIIVPLRSPGGLLVLHGNNGSMYWRKADLGKEIYSSPVIQDIDGDGYPEIFVGSTDIYKDLDGSGRIACLSYDGRILYQTFAWRPCGGGISIADTDGDGEFELYVGDRHIYVSDAGYGKGAISFWARNLTERWNHPNILMSSHIPMIADVNQDGVLDVIVGHLFGGLAVLNSTDGSAIKKTLGIPNDAPIHYQPSVYDIDLDGNLELLMADGQDYTGYDTIVWDLVEWKIDARISLGKCHYGPQVADITGDGIMEIIVANYTSFFALDKNYTIIAQIDGLRSKLTYAVVQDIDGDGYNELVYSSTTGRIYAFDTPARRSNPRPRTEVQFYSEYRLGAAEYIPPPGALQPTIRSPSPADHTKNVPISLSELQFTLIDHQRDTMNYTVTTFPNIGSDTGFNVINGRYTLQITDLAPTTMYTWMINVTDGNHWTNTTYTFKTGSIIPWWNNNWKQRKIITIDHNKVAYSLSDFPILIDITDSDLINDTQPNGNDIVFTDANNTQLAHEIEYYNSTTGRLIAWLNIPLLSSTTNTQIYMYYKNMDSTSQQQSAQVWDSNFVMVQHLEELSGNRIDSTNNSNIMSPYGGVSKSRTGKIDGTDLFDGINDYAQVNNSLSLNPSSVLSIELWINLSPTSNYINLVSKGTYSQYYLRLGPTEGRAYWFVRFSDGTTKSIESGDIGWKWNTWHHIVAIVDTETQATALYLDGVRKLSGTFTTGKTLISTSNPIMLSDSGLRRIKGGIDEIRISNVPRSAEWILTSYNTQKDPSKFYTVGSKQTIPENPIVFAPSPEDDDTNIPASQSELSFNITNYQNKPMNYTVTTSPNIGSGNNTNVPKGRYSLSVSGLTRYTTYTWTISVTDGTHQTNTTFSFTTWSGQPPTHDTPLLLKSGNDLICYNQTTYDPDNPEIANIYNWYKNNLSITNLLLPFDTNSSKDAKDYSGYNNDGSIIRNVAWTSNGIVGGAYQFNRGFIRIPHSSTLDGDGYWSEITVEHWIYLTESQSGRRTVAKIPSYEIGIIGGGTNRIAAGVWIDNGVWNVSRYRQVTYSTRLNTNEWYHVAFTYKNGTGLTLYVNGVAVATNTGISGNIQPSGSLNPLYIGWFDYFKGMIDEVRIYPESLSSQQINQRYEETKDGLSNSSKIVSEEINIGDIWKCEVTPNDLNQDGEPKFSNSVTIGFKDDFSDSSTNHELWETLEKNSGTLSETNNRVELTVPSGPGTAGYITQESYDLSDAYIQVDISNQYLCEAALAITLDGIYDHFWYSNDFYVIEKHYWSLDVDGLTLKIKRRINGTDPIYLYEGNWTGPTGTLAIKIESGTIFFYEDGILRYSEPFELETYNGFIHIEANTWDTNYNGTDYFDNFTFQNNKPYVEDLTITPTTPITNDNLTGTYTYLDPDNDPENGTRIRWYKNDTLQPELNETLVVPYNLTTKGDIWYITITPSDGKEFGETQTSPHVLIQNTPPTIDSFTPENTTLETNEGETINFTHTSSDLDNDPLTYSWQLDGTEQSTTQNWTYNTSNSSSGMHNITLAVKDLEYITLQQWIVIIVNTNQAPQASNLTISPTNPVTTDQLQANYTYTDPDGDLENNREIRWFKIIDMISELQSDLNDSLVVPSVLTAKGEVWSFTVRVSDGIEFGLIQTSTNISIQNTPPSLLPGTDEGWIIQIYPITGASGDQAYENDTLGVHIYNWTDADGDPPGYIYQWLRDEDGQWIEIEGASSATLGPEHFVTGDFIRVLVTPYDGEDTGIPRGDNIIIS